MKNYLLIKFFKSMKKIIRLTESDLHKIIEGAVKRTINEIAYTKKGFSKIKEAKNDDIENGEYDNSFLTPDDEDYVSDVYDDYEDRDMRDYLDSQDADDGYDDDFGYSDGDLYRGAIH